VYIHINNKWDYKKIKSHFVSLCVEFYLLLEMKKTKIDLVSIIQ